MAIVLSQIWGTGARSQICKKYIFEYITMIENIVKEGIEKGELSKGDPNVIASGIFGIICAAFVVYEAKYIISSIKKAKLSLDDLIKDSYE